MVAEKMFWEVWRNVTSATNNWSLGGNNGANKGPASKSSTQRTRYNRLRSGPTKSISQPANLTSLVGLSSSTESLTEANGSQDAPQEDLKEENCKKSSGKISSRQQRNTTGSSSFMKHSISSFFPFTSCASSTKATAAQSNSLETGFAGKSSSVARIIEDEQQKDSSSFRNNNSGSGILSNILSGGGNTNNGTFHEHSMMTESSSSSTVPENSNWDQPHQSEKEVVENNLVQAVCEEDEISDLDSEVEQLTCDVCERCFPTLKMLAAHQRKKRHYGCLQCDSIFPSREVLEYHREQMCHYDYAIDYYDEEEGDEEDGEFFESEDDENGIKDENCDDEEKERLL